MLDILLVGLGLVVVGGLVKLVADSILGSGSSMGFVSNVLHLEI